MSKSLNSLFQSAAIASIGAGIVATVGISPASAINLQTYQVNVDFGSDGSASGYYTVDQDLLPATLDNSVSLSEWDVTVKDGSGQVINRFYNSFINISSPLYNNNQHGNIYKYSDDQDYLEFQKYLLIPDYPETLALGLKSGFTGIGSTNSLLYSDENSNYFDNGTATITQSNNTPVPEPLTLGGMVISSAFGLWMKRQQKALVKP